nr:hypothetical protein [Diaporthe negative-stranded RNA virus 1]
MDAFHVYVDAVCLYSSIFTRVIQEQQDKEDMIESVPITVDNSEEEYEVVESPAPHTA